SARHHRPRTTLRCSPWRPCESREKPGRAGHGLAWPARAPRGRRDRPLGAFGRSRVKVDRDEPEDHVVREHHPTPLSSLHRNTPWPRSLAVPGADCPLTRPRVTMHNWACARLSPLLSRSSPLAGAASSRRTSYPPSRAPFPPPRRPHPEGARVPPLPPPAPPPPL